MNKLIIAMFGAALFYVQGDYCHSNQCVICDTNHTFAKTTLIMAGMNVIADVVGWQDYDNKFF